MTTITGGEQVGNNLFFLLEEFSVSENEEITFESAIDVENIFIEIAGNEPSIVNGLLKATGKSDIFFANPNGIIFNENSRLEIEGSFLATTANSIDFADGTTLVVGQDNSNVGLTDSIPIGLNFLGDNASINVNGNGSQINRLESNQFDRGNNPDLSQLTVEPDKTLALIGGEIKIEGGSLTAVSGHIELGGINEGIVALNQDAEKLTLGFEEVSSFSDIELSAKSAVDVSGAGTSSIQINADDILLRDGSVLLSQSTGDNSLGSITINAAKSLTISDIGSNQISSAIVSETLDEGTAGSLFISAESVSLENDATVSSETFGDGNAGTITLEASDLMVVDDSTISIGTGGAINVDSSELTLDNAGGNITIDSSDLIIIPPTLKLTAETAQIGYIAYLGRPGDRGGIDGLRDILSKNNISYDPRGNDDLTGEEQVIYDRITNQLASSSESDRIFGIIDNNRDKVNQVYQFAFERDAETEGLEYWTEQLDKGYINPANFAFEIALGARNEDISILVKKIESAKLFSKSIDTQTEIEVYQGLSGESFGRNWLDDFGETVSSQAQVDSALIDLVNG